MGALSGCTQPVNCRAANIAVGAWPAPTCPPPKSGLREFPLMRLPPAPVRVHPLGRPEHIRRCRRQAMPVIWVDIRQPRLRRLPHPVKRAAPWARSKHWRDVRAGKSIDDGGALQPFMKAPPPASSPPLVPRRGAVRYRSRDPDPCPAAPARRSDTTPARPSPSGRPRADRASTRPTGSGA